MRTAKDFDPTNVQVRVDYENSSSPITIVANGNGERRFVVDTKCLMSWGRRQYLAQMTAACLLLWCTTFNRFTPPAMAELEAMVDKIVNHIPPAVLSDTAGHSWRLTAGDRRSHWTMKEWLMEVEIP
jgi:hypothetical protein